VIESAFCQLLILVLSTSLSIPPILETSLFSH
jgi:hypothetical protein